MNYNKNINKFIKENSIDIDLLMSNNETMVYTKKDISRVIATCGMYKEEIKANISISDVIGKNRGKTQNILSELNDLFDEKNNKYILNKQLLEEYKANYEHNDLRFEISDENRFNNILYQFGGINICNNNGNLVYILPIK